MPESKAKAKARTKQVPATVDPSQAMIAKKPDRVALDFSPTNIDQAWRLADLLSKSALIPSPLRGKPHDVLVILLTGHELKMSSMQSLRSIHVIEGRPAMSAEMMVARCKARPTVCEYFRMIESTDEKAIYETKRTGNPEPTRHEYTIADAQKAGLANRDNWKKNTKAMLRARASSGLARIEYPDLVQGIVTHDEVAEIRESVRELEGARTAELKETIAKRSAAPAPDMEIPAHDPVTGEITEEQPQESESRPKTKTSTPAADDAPVIW